MQHAGAHGPQLRREISYYLFGSKIEIVVGFDETTLSLLAFIPRHGTRARERSIVDESEIREAGELLAGRYVEGLVQPGAYL